MLKNGWKLLENDDYSSAILKGYRYFYDYRVQGFFATSP